MDFAAVDEDMMEDAELAQILNSVEVEVDDSLSECLHTISDTQIERGKGLDDVGGEKLIKSASEEVAGVEVRAVILNAPECRIRVDV